MFNSFRIFSDENFRDEISTDLNEITINNSLLDIEQKIHVRVSVEYSEKLNDLYQLLDKYQMKLHLTLSFCWLTQTRNGNSDIHQILIENGCPNEKVRFHDKSTTSLRFSFNFLETIKKDSKFYLHCLPDLCTDFSGSVENNLNKFKSCQNITNSCQNQYFTSKYHHDYQKQTKENIKNHLKNVESNCNYQFTKGPIFLKNKNPLAEKGEKNILEYKMNNLAFSFGNFFISF